MIESVWTILCQLSPWLLIGMVISGVMHVCLPRNFVQKQFRGFGGVVKAVAIGVPLPLCSCGVIPAGIGLKNEGADDGAAVGFLISTPQTGVDSILVSVSFFGWPFAIFKMGAALILGAIGGCLANFIGDKTQVEESPELQRLSQAESPKNIGAVGEHALEVFRSFWVWLLVGVLVSAAIASWVPEQWLKSVSALGLVPAMVLVLFISVPLYICATASVPMAAALVAGGFPPAAALVFLMAGPATNAMTMGAIYGRFGLKVLLIYLCVIVFGSFAAGAVFDGILTSAVTNQQLSGHAHHHWLASVSAIIVLGLVAYCAFEKFALNSQVVETQVNQLVHVKGMHCQNCAAKLSRILKDEFGTLVDQVSFEPQAIRLSQPIDVTTRERLKRAIEQAGYESTDG